MEENYSNLNFDDGNIYFQQLNTLHKKYIEKEDHIQLKVQILKYLST